MIRVVWALTIISRLRDRLRCPKCAAVGTYKPHAATAEVPWRWLCKWCGYYRDAKCEGFLCGPNLSKKYWDFKPDTSPTPSEIINEQLPGVWPWRG